MTAQLSPEQVAALLSGPTSQAVEGQETEAQGRRKAYRPVYDRCARCHEQHPGLWHIRAAGRLPRFDYVCGWCFEELKAERGE